MMSKPLRTDTPLRILTAELQAAIPRLMREMDVPGLSIALIRNWRLAYAQGFGLRSMASRKPVDADTIFEAASLSKPPFAFCFMKLCEQELLDLDTPLQTYLQAPYLPDDSRSALITGRMALSHTTGFSQRNSDDQVLSIKYDPGQQFAYANDGFEFAKLAAEQVTGQSLHGLMQAHVFGQLGMSRTGYKWSEEFGPWISDRHGRDGDPRHPRQHTDRTYASRSMYTTAPEYAKFVIHVMEAFRGDAEMPAAHWIRQMLTPQVTISAKLSWSLGFGVQRANGTRSYWQWGNLGDVKNYVLFYPSEGMGIVILTNSANGTRVYRRLVAESMGGEHPAFDQRLPK